MTKPIAIHWFRQDLRLADNPALLAASAHGTVLPVYILDDHNAGPTCHGRSEPVVASSFPPVTRCIP